MLSDDAARPGPLPVDGKRGALCHSRHSTQTNPVDPVVKKRGLWWDCGEATTRSKSSATKNLSPTLWGCGQKQVEAFFQN
jgi:hypothetical protein